MASIKQIGANQKNARKSTGPKSSAGKRRSSGNALKHGLTADQVVLPSENIAAFEEILNGLEKELNPETVLQRMTFERIVSAIWRLRRVIHFERELFRFERLQRELNHYRSVAEGGLPIANDRDPATIMIKEAEPDWEWSESEENYMAAKEEFERDPPINGMLIRRMLVDQGITEKLSRYERSIRRNLLEDLDQFKLLKDEAADGSSFPDEPMKEC